MMKILILDLEDKDEEEIDVNIAELIEWFSINPHKAVGNTALDLQ